jgi:phosphate:Na+ symporter
LTGQNLNEGQMRQVTTVSKTVTDLERVADLAENQTELAVIMKDNQLKLSDKAAEELTQLYEKATILFETSRQIYKSEDMDLKIEMDQVLDDTHRLLETSQINHLERTRTQQYNTQAEVVFLDALGNLERIGAHAMSIVRTVSRLKF